MKGKKRDVFPLVRGERRKERRRVRGREEEEEKPVRVERSGKRG